MAENNVDQVLDPQGETLRGIVRGRRGAGRFEVTLLWPRIEKALDAGASITTIWEALSQSGLVSIQRRAFSNAVQARREGARGSGTAARPATELRPSAQSAEASEAATPVTEPRPSAGSAEASQAAKSDAPAQAEAARPKLPEIKPGIPHRPWRTGPRQAPDPNAVFRPRDPLADD